MSEIDDLEDTIAGLIDPRSAEGSRKVAQRGGSKAAYLAMRKRGQNAGGAARKLQTFQAPVSLRRFSWERQE